jgi:hypothetical protein
MGNRDWTLLYPLVKSQVLPWAIWIVELTADRLRLSLGSSTKLKSLISRKRHCKASRLQVNCSGNITSNITPQPQRHYGLPAT